MLAAFKVLTGFKVDIVTSSPILAERDVKEKYLFYKTLAIKIADNIDRNYKCDGIKDCYKDGIDVIYGNSSYF